MIKKFLTFIVCMVLSFNALASQFKLTSSDLKPGQFMKNSLALNGFGCQGNNISLELSWQGAPTGTKSFAITMYDPDAQTGSGWWHWVVFNISSIIHYKYDMGLLSSFAYDNKHLNERSIQ